MHRVPATTPATPLILRMMIQLVKDHLMPANQTQEGAEVAAVDGGDDAAQGADQPFHVPDATRVSPSSGAGAAGLLPCQKNSRA